MNNSVYSNEKWWQENGKEWALEVDERKKYQALYGVQEIVISSYLSRLPKGSKVLEFGAGFGRHASYIKDLNNVEYYAVDQSETMLQCFRERVENKNNLHDKITLIEPRTKLPFEDGYFDVVFTVSVLIHIKPEHIEEILKELVRVSKKVIFHFENKLTNQSELHYKDHNGCWKHALPYEYKNLEYETHVIDNLSLEQDVYYVYKEDDENYKFKINEVIMRKVAELGNGLDVSVKYLEGEAGWRAKELEKREEQIKILKGEAGWRAEELEKREEQIKTLEGEVGWRAEELEKREEQIKTLEGEAGWRAKELEKREEQIKTLEGEAGWRAKELEKREEQIKVLKGEVGWREEELEKREEQIKTLEGEVGWRTEELEKREEQIKILKGEAGWRAKELEKREEEIKTLEGEVGWRTEELKKKGAEVSELRRVEDENRQELFVAKNTIQKMNSEMETYKNMLNEIHSSNSWKLIQKLKKNQFIRTVAKKALSVYKKTKVENVEISTSNNKEQKTVLSSQKSMKVFENENTLMLKNYLDTIAESECIAISHSDWLGVSNSTRELFDNVVHFKELTSIDEVGEIARLLLEKNPKQVIFSGFARGWNTLCKTIKAIKPEVEIIVFWHGNTTHMYEDYSWIMYQELLELYDENVLDKWAFAKESMYKVYAHRGINSYFLKNHVEKNDNKNILDVEDVKNVEEMENIKIGLYASGNTWNKNAYTQIAAASLFENATINMIPYNDRMKVFAEQLNVDVSGYQSNVKREVLFKSMEENDINFYITFSECAPLLPLESLNQGVICLTGPNHHYFRDNKLEEYLVVNNPDDAVEIYEKAIKALKNRHEIMKLYKQWHLRNAEESMLTKHKLLNE